MRTKDKLLRLLESHRGSYFSGEEIAELLEVSRTAVWKAVKSLQNDGFEIDAVQNKGYRLSEHADILSERGIRTNLKEQSEDLEIEVLPQANSTNALLREKANAGAPEGTVVIAGTQTQGRGRLGRSFFSPPETGIYLSLLLRPEGYSPAQAIRVTTMAAVAACEAIEAVSGRQTKIKWVNDIFMDGKKVCGILTEGSFGLETGKLEYIILGVGMNAYTPENGFPEELEQIAGSIFPEKRCDGKNQLAAAFLDRFMHYYRTKDFSDYSEKYHDRSFVIGRHIRVLSFGNEKQALALDVDKECRLIVRYENGETEALSSAEISIKM